LTANVRFIFEYDTFLIKLSVFALANAYNSSIYAVILNGIKPWI